MTKMNNLTVKFKAGYPLLYLVSGEDLRCRREIEKSAGEAKRTVFYWSVVSGGLIEGGRKSATTISGTESPHDVLKYIKQGDGSGKVLPGNSVIILRHFHRYSDDPGVQGFMLDALQSCKKNGRTIIVTTPTLQFPGEWAKELAVVEVDLPDKETLNKVLDGIIEGSPNLPHEQRPTTEERELLLQAVKGLALNETENVLAEAMIRNKEEGIRYFDHRAAMNLKCDTLRRGGLLEHIPEAGEIGMDMLGGMDNLKEWVFLRREVFSPEAKAFGLEDPKGLLAVGIPGTGKSLASRAVASALQLPLYRLDAGRLFGGIVGASEANTREAISRAEASAPCVMWIDEIEKGFSGSTSGNLDAGVTARVVGTFLTWLQEKKSAVFVFCTANDIGNLPPELLRKGRFDEIFSVDLPNEVERKEIMKIHVRKRGRAHLLDKLDLDSLVEATQGFSGAEIEAGIKDALFRAFSNKKDLNRLDLLDAYTHTTPLSRTMGEKLVRLSDWYKLHTRPANKALDEEPPTSFGRSVDA